MKKFVIATAVAAASLSSAHAAPTVYGKLQLTLDYVGGADEDQHITTQNYVNGVRTSTTSSKHKVDNGDVTQLNSDSRIGFRGTESLSENTDLLYQLEYRIYVDNAGDTSKGKNGGQFTARDTYLGVTNKQYGTLMAGRLSAIDDSINYVSQAVGQYDNSFGGAAWDGNRVNNAFTYLSPSYDGMTFMAMYGLDEKNNANLTDRNLWGAGIKYEPEGQPYRGGITYLKSGNFNSTRVSGAYQLNPTIGVGGMYELSDSGLNDSKKENVFSVSGTYKTATPWTAYAQADFIKNVAFADDADSKQFVVGGKYAFNQAATGHIYAGYRDNELKLNVNNLKDGTGTIVNTRSDIEGFGVGAGLEYRF